MQQLIDMFFKMFLGESSWQKFTAWEDHPDGLEIYATLHSRSADCVNIN